MDVVLKISNDYTPATTISQFIDPAGLSFSDELVNTGSLNFTVPLDDEQIGSVLEFKKVALYAIENGNDNFLWSGYVDQIENDFGYATVRCGDEKDFLRNKMLFGSVDWTSVNLQTAMTAIINQANSRKGPNEGLLTFTTTAGAMNIGKKFSDGTSYYDLITQICAALKLEWKVLFNQIYIQQNIGTDRSLPGPNYRQFIWNNNSPNENTITKFKNTRPGKDIATHVLGKGSGGVSVIAGDKSVYGSIERSVSMDDGNIATQTQAYVDAHQVSQIERDMDVIVDDIDARNLMVGDTVAVKIIHGSVLADTSENLKIIQRNFVFENKKPTVTVNVAKVAKQVSSMENFLADLNRRVKRFELY
jgi:hypothetical protein